MWNREHAVEVRTKVKPKSQLSEKDAVAQVTEHLNGPIDLREGNIPEGYHAWKEKEHERLLLAAAPAAAPLALTAAPAAAQAAAPLALAARAAYSAT